MKLERALGKNEKLEKRVGKTRSWKVLSWKVQGRSWKVQAEV